MRVEDVICFAGLGAFPNDDQAAIRQGAAARDGHLYTGSPVTAGYRRVRQPSQCLCVALVLEDGTVATGDGVSVQYAGAGGREPLLDARGAADAFAPRLRDAFVRASVSSFRESSERLEEALPSDRGRVRREPGVADCRRGLERCTVTETVAREYGTGARSARSPCSPNPARTVAERSTG